jgi:hypothetical protein
MAVLRAVVALVLALIAPASATGATSGARLRARAQLNVNPIRRVVTMLQMMQKKIEEEGKKEQELFDAFMCYCKNGVGDLTTSIKDGEAKIVQLESSIEATDSSVKQLLADIEEAVTDHKDVEASMEKAESIRDKELKAWTKFSAEAKANIAATGSAITSLEKGMSGAFLQTETRSVSIVKRLSISMDLSDADRDVLASFLSNEGSSDYAPSSGEITGILKQMKETMERDLKDAEATEKEAIQDFDALMGPKEKQLGTLTKEKETKMLRQGEEAVELATQQDDLEDTNKNVAFDKKFLIDVTKNCKTKQAEKEANDKMRAEEAVALADTIKILNDDDALDLFKKTLPTPSLLQLGRCGGWHDQDRMVRTE